MAYENTHLVEYFSRVWHASVIIEQAATLQEHAQVQLSYISLKIWLLSEGKAVR